MNTVSKSIFTFFLLVSFFSCTEQKDKHVVVSQSVEKDCFYSFDESATKVFWAAYKTEDKLKVVGQFKESKTDRADQKFSSLEALVNGINFSINTASSTSGDEIRDLSLKDYFFQLFTENFEINGSLAEMGESLVTATVDVFGVQKTIKLTYSMDEEVLKMKGTLSLEEIGAVKATIAFTKNVLSYIKVKLGTMLM